MIGMIRPRPLTSAEIRDRMEQYHMQIAPLVRNMVLIESFRPQPHIVMHADGRMEIGERAPLPPDSQAVLDQCRAMIDEIRKTLFPEPDDATS